MVQGDKVLLRLFLLTLLFVKSYANTDVFEASLGNGLRLMVLPDHRVPQVWTSIWYNVGSKDELDGHTGLAHILEHVMFHGTKLHPDFDKEIYACGGYANARTSFDYTNYYSLVRKDCLAKMLELEADRMSNLILDEKKISLELKAVREERLQNEQSQSFLAFEQALSSLYIRGPYHHLPIGWMSDIENATLNDIKDWYKKWYLPNNALVVVGGDVDSAEVLNLVSKYFADIKPKLLPLLSERRNAPHRGNINLTVKSKTFSGDSMSLMYIVPSLVSANSEQDPYALLVLSAMLSYGENSILQQKFVKTGKALSVGSTYSFLRRYQSDFIIGAEGDKLLDSKLVLLELQKLAKGQFSQQALDRAKTQILAEHIFGQDQFTDFLFMHANYEILGIGIKRLKQFPQSIQSVSAKDVQSVVKKYFIDKYYVQQNLIRS